MLCCLNEEKDFDLFLHKFNQRRWLDFEKHKNLRPNTKIIVKYVCSIKFFVTKIDGYFQTVGMPVDYLLAFFQHSGSIFTLHRNQYRTYDDNLCFIRNVIYARNLIENPGLKPLHYLKETDVYFLYAELHENCFPDLPEHPHDFPDFSFDQLETACNYLKINGFIYEWNVFNKGKAAELLWQSHLFDNYLCLNNPNKPGRGVEVHPLCFFIYKFFSVLPILMRIVAKTQ